MKKLLTAIMLITLIFTMFAGVPAYADTVGVSYEEALKYVELERTDIYAVDAYRVGDAIDDWRRGYPNTAKVVDEVTAGIPDDYEKAKAICNWVYKNYVVNVTLDSKGDLLLAKDSKDFDSVDSYGIRGAQMAQERLYQVAGFPTKYTGPARGGSWWVEVYINNRWIFTDAARGEFDIPLSDFCKHHDLGPVVAAWDNEQLWNGSLYFLDSNNDQTLKEIKTFPLNGLVTSTYGFDANCLYVDRACTKPVNLKTMKVNARHNTIYVKTASVVYYTQLDNEYKSVKPYVIKTEGTTQLSGETVPAGSKLTAPKAPTKAGYTFIGWYTGKVDDKDAKKWDYENDTVKEDMQLYARFQKGSVSYTVTFNSNSGTAVKGVKVAANNTFSKPIDPTRKGYRFAGWYKDSKCTKAWNFATDTVTANTTLYAAWIDVNAIIANPTASNVLVNGKSTAFEAYNINGNNYFKLRDLAKIVSGTEKQFEVTWDGTKNAIKLISNKAYTVTGGELGKGDGKAKTATLSTATIYKDGVVVSLTAYTINGNNYFKLRDLAQAFNIGVTWDGATNTVGIDTTIDYTP